VLGGASGCLTRRLIWQLRCSRVVQSHTDTGCQLCRPSQPAVPSEVSHQQSALAGAVLPADATSCFAEHGILATPSLQRYRRRSSPETAVVHSHSNRRSALAIGSTSLSHLLKGRFPRLSRRPSSPAPRWLNFALLPARHPRLVRSGRLQRLWTRGRGRCRLAAGSDGSLLLGGGNALSIDGSSVLGDPRPSCTRRCSAAACGSA
jgi:hypothetical protein